MTSPWCWEFGSYLPWWCQGIDTLFVLLFYRSHVESITKAYDIKTLMKEISGRWKDPPHHPCDVILVLSWFYSWPCVWNACTDATAVATATDADPAPNATSDALPSRRKYLPGQCLGAFLCKDGLYSKNNFHHKDKTVSRPSYLYDGNLYIWYDSNFILQTAKSSRHDDVIKWKHFPRYWPFVRGIHRVAMSSCKALYSITPAILRRQDFEPMGTQFSLEYAILSTERFETASDHWSNTGPNICQEWFQNHQLWYIFLGL